VIMNLALWFAMHVVFRDVRSFDFLGLSLDLPVLASVDWSAALLALGAMIAMLRFKIGMIPTLSVCALAGVVLSAVAR
jgi:chromate transporter